MTQAGWLAEPEQRAWRSLMAMQDDLSAFTDRRLRSCHDISTSDHEALPTSPRRPTAC